MEPCAINIQQLELYLKRFQNDTQGRSYLLQKTFAATIGLMPLGQAQSFDQEKFFPWTEQQKEMMIVLVSAGANPNPYMKYYDYKTGSVLFNLFLLGFEEFKRNILIDKIDFMINNLGVDINTVCPVTFDIIPISCAKKIIRESSLISYSDCLKNSFIVANNNLNERIVDYNVWLSSLPGKKYIEEQFDINLEAVVDTFYRYKGDLSKPNKKNRNLLYYVIKSWQLSWNIDFLKKLIEFYKIPVMIDSGNNTLIHAMARSPFFFFTIKEDVESCPDFNHKWNLFSYICQFMSFTECNIKNNKDYLPHEITLHKYQEFLKSNPILSHIVIYADEKYF